LDPVQLIYVVDETGALVSFGGDHGNFLLSLFFKKKEK